MAVHETNDVGLPDFICRHQRVIVKFIGKTCAKCNELAPVYESLSNSQAYQSIIFLKLDAESNPIACKEVNQHGTPFMVAYRGGDLISHKLVASQTDIENILANLLN